MSQPPPPDPTQPNPAGPWSTGQPEPGSPAHAGQAGPGQAGQPGSGSGSSEHGGQPGTGSPGYADQARQGLPAQAGSASPGQTGQAWSSADTASGHGSVSSGPVYSGGGGPYAPQAFGGSFGAPAEPAPKLPWSRAIAVTVAVFLVVGAIAGWAWQQYAPLAQYTIDENGGALGEEQMTRVFGPDGMFVAIGFLTALVLGAALFWWLRDYGPWAVAVVCVGSVVGSAVAWGVGMLLGHDPLDPRLQAAKPGDLLAAPLELHTWTPLAAWLVGAALAAAIISALTWRAEPVATTSVSSASESPAQVK